MYWKSSVLEREEENICSDFCWLHFLWSLSTITSTAPHPSRRLWAWATLTVVHLSPTALSHTWQHRWLDRRLLQGCIRLHKLYSIFLQPVSPYASTITSYHICFNCSRSCEILCIPMFYGWLLPQTLPIPLFAPWCPFKHLRVFIRPFFWLLVVSIVTTHNVFHFHHYLIWEMEPDSATLLAHAWTCVDI